MPTLEIIRQIEEIKKCTRFFSDYFYTDTLKNCIDAILKNQIYINKLVYNVDLDSEDDFDIDEISDEDREIVESEIREITKEAINTNENLQQKMMKTIEKYGKEKPIVAKTIKYFFMVLLPIIVGNIFTSSWRDTYIQNYTTNNTIIVDSNKYFLDNARYVSIEKLDVRVKPNEKYEIISELSCGDLVSFLNSMEDWSKIEFINKQTGSKCEGWVLTSGLEEFKDNFLVEYIENKVTESNSTIMEQKLSKKELLKLVDSLDLPKSEYYILGGGSLVMFRNKRNNS